MLSCSQRNTGITTIDGDVETQRISHGEDLVGLISDSGIIRGRLVTKVQDAYTNDTESYSHFPEGIYFEQFDSLFQISGTVRADTAYHYEKTDLWRLIGNVVVKNAGGTTCETSELFWNSRAPANSRKSFYTDKFVKITTPTKVTTSEGMESNQSLTNYIFYSNAMEFEVDEDNSVEE